MHKCHKCTLTASSNSLRCTRSSGNSCRAAWSLLRNSCRDPEQKVSWQSKTLTILYLSVAFCSYLDDWVHVCISTMLLLLIAIEALALWHVLRQIKNCDQQRDCKLNFNFAALQDSPKTLLHGLKCHSLRSRSSLYLLERASAMHKEVCCDAMYVKVLSEMLHSPFKETTRLTTSYAHCYINVYL